MPCTVFRIAAAAATATGRRALAAIAACMGAVVTNSPHGPRAGRAVLALPVGQGESGRARVKRSLTASACRAYCAPCRAGRLTLFRAASAGARPFQYVIPIAHHLCAEAVRVQPAKMTHMSGA